MTDPDPAWQRRVLRVVVVAEWLGLAIGIAAAVAQTDTPQLAYGGAGLGGLWVLAASAVPVSALRRPLALDAFTVGGVITTMTAVTLTGGASSPFFLLSLTPVIHAAVFGGFRVAVTAGLLSGLLLVTVTLAQSAALGPAIGLSVLYVVMGVTVAQIGRILVDMSHRTSEAEQSSLLAAQRVEHLENANSLLSSLADIAATDVLNPVSIGRAALETIVSRYPDSAASAALDGENGPILLGKFGSAPTPAHEATIPLETGERQVGFVRLSTREPLGDEEIEGLRTSFRPLALAFSNALLLQDISRHAVKEERTRLARELHDEIGPGLASLGLSLDLALIQGADQRELTDHLQALRERVGSLVDEVRSTVADLRTQQPVSLVSYLEELATELPSEPPIVVELDERRPVRPSLAGDVHGIVGEAVRNSSRHSKGTQVRVRGWIDFDRGRVVIEDDGIGFNPALPVPGHFGLTGMDERAQRSGIRLDMTSGATGSGVTVEWGDS